MAVEEIIIIKVDVTDNIQPVCDNAEFISIPEMSLNVEPFISGLGEEIRKANDLLEGVHVIHDTNVIIAAPV